MREKRRDNVAHGPFGRARKRTLAPSRAESVWVRGRRWPILVPIWVGILIGAAYGAGWLDGLLDKAGPLTTSGARTDIRVRFNYCHIGGGYNCVVDGDTLWFRGQKIRIADIDAPETHDYRCAAEKALGDRATKRLHDLMESGAITLLPIGRDEDVYGRKLRIVQIDGKSVGDTLVNEGLARPYGAGRRPWC